MVKLKYFDALFKLNKNRAEEIKNKSTTRDSHSNLNLDSKLVYFHKWNEELCSNSRILNEQLIQVKKKIKILKYLKLK